MWILHYLPDSLILWFTNILLGIGVLVTVAAFFVKFVPLINRYRIPAQILGIFLLTAGVYFRGGYGVEMAWRDRVAEVEEKLKQVEAQSQEENAKIQTKYINRQNVIQLRGKTITEYVDREVVKYDNTCVIPKEFISAHNQAAEAPAK